MSSSNPNDPTDPGKAPHPAPSSATGMFSAPQAPQPSSEPAADDFFAQFREPAPPAVPLPAQVSAAAPVNPPAFVNTPLAQQPPESQKPAVRPETPQLREVFIKSSTGKVRTSPPPEPVVAQPPPTPTPIQAPGDFTRIFMASETPSAATSS